MLHRISLVSLAAVLAVLICSAVRQVEAAAVEREARANVPTSTVTVLSTSLLDGAATSTVLTKKICGAIDADASSPCRRKRHYWVDVPILIAHDPEAAAYMYHQFQPSPVFSVEPTPTAQFRHQSAPWPALIDASLDETLDSRTYGAVLTPVNTIRTSLLAIATSVINSFLTPVDTVTSVVSGYSSTVTTTIFTTTQTYTIAGCIPEGIQFSTC